MYISQVDIPTQSNMPPNKRSFRRGRNSKEKEDDDNEEVECEGDENQSGEEVRSGSIPLDVLKLDPIYQDRLEYRG
jgi:hypothetical protein